MSPTLRKHLRLIAGAQALVLGGGGYFNDQWRSMLASLCVGLDMAAAVGTPVVIFGQTLGPFSEKTVRASLKRRLRRVAAIAYRDAQSAKVAAESGLSGPRLRLMADEANLLQPPQERSAACDKETLDIGVMCQLFRPHLNPHGPSPAGRIKDQADYVEHLCAALSTP